VLAAACDDAAPPVLPLLLSMLKGRSPFPFRHPWHVLLCGMLVAWTKCRLVLRLAPEHHYFFWLYIVYCGALAALAALSLGHWPARGALLLYSAREDGYLVRLPLESRMQSRDAALQPATIHCFTVVV
jgi:hypothetical protein